MGLRIPFSISTIPLAARAPPSGRVTRRSRRPPKGRRLVFTPPLRRRQRTVVALDGAIQLRLAASPDPSGERVLEDFAARHLARQPIGLPEQRPVDGDRDLRFGRHGMTINRTIRRMTSRPATPPPLLAQRQGLGSQRFCFTELVPA